jgi:hypothetical protein
VCSSDLAGPCGALTLPGRFSSLPVIG